MTHTPSKNTKQLYSSFLKNSLKALRKAGAPIRANKNKLHTHTHSINCRFEKKN